CGLIGLQALVVETCRVGASQVGECVAAADVLQGGVDTRNGVGPLHLAQIYLWLDIVHIMIVAPNHDSFADERNQRAIGKDERSPGCVRVRCWPRGWLGRDGS